jgi:starch synthase
MGEEDLVAESSRRTYRIVFIASEGVPFAKTGGLADVVGSLPKELIARGHEVIVVLPRYSLIDGDRWGLRPAVSPMGVWMGTGEEWCATLTSDRSEVPFYFIESNHHFDRWGIYHDADMGDYRDNARRFGFFTKAALQLCRDLGFKPDVVHAHDWPAALAPAYLKTWYWNDATLGDAASVLTIHNVAYQGKYPAGVDYDYLGLGWTNFRRDTFEDHGLINMLKGGIAYADLLTTVSPTYADETRGDIGGNGLGPALRERGASYWGILNGADYGTWNPATDPLIPANYSPRSMKGKARCKAALQERMLLEEDPTIPVFGVIGRFVDQKGYDLLAGAIDRILATMRCQFVFLGSGDKKLEWTFGPLPERYPGRVGAYIGYNEELSHWIEAGADFFCMPSRFEPCGLNQIYSLKYGTLPLVRATGGLNDTVRQYDEATGEGTGFKFQAPTAQAVYDVVGWAVSTYYDRPAHMKRMIHAAMDEDFSWNRSAEIYEAAYARAIANKYSNH